MKITKDKIIYWFPRILSIAFILFLAMFSLDVFSPELTVWEMIIGFFMHNIPVIILSIVLYFSWKYEIVGGVAFILAGLLYTTMVWVGAFTSGQFEWYMLTYPLIIAGPAFLIGAFFLFNWFRR